MSYHTDLLPFPIRINEHETVSVLWFQRISEIERHFELSEPMTAEEIGEIIGIAREGIVHAAISPFMEEIYSKRCLMYADSAERLAYAYRESCYDI